MTEATLLRPTRRAVLSGGALVLGFCLMPPVLAQEGHGGGTALPGSLKTNPMLDSWIKIDGAGKVTVFTGKSELGQGIKTALLQVAAEFLGVPVDAITLVTSDTARTPNEGYTAGSQSMQNSGTAIMNAAAQVRAIMIGLAASRLGMPAAQLTVEDRAIATPDGRSRVTFAELFATGFFHDHAQPTSDLKDPRSYTIVGKSMRRVDIPAKLTGGVAYVQDMRLDGMVHARIVRPPSYGAKLRAVDAGPAAAMPGVKRVVHDGNYLAVIADREFRAIKAMEVLAASAQWDQHETMPGADAFYDWLKRQPGKAITIKDQKGGAAPAAKTLHAEYRRPYQMHGAIGPSCAVAQFTDGKLTVWSHAQGMFPLRAAIAELLKLPQDNVRFIHVEGSGCYGHNGADDAAADAAYLAAAYPGVPVRVQWMREQEHQWEPYGPGMIMDVTGAIDAAGNIVAWDFANWSDTHSMRPGGAGATLVGQHIAARFAPPPPKPGSQPSGFGDRNIIPLYKIPNMRLIYNFVPHQRVRASALRGLGAYANIFAIESFMDELAAAAGADPVAFRLKHLTDRRGIDVVRLAAEKFGWRPHQRGADGRGRGFGFAKYKNLAAYCAVAVELAVEHETGAVRLLRAVGAVDSGQAVNPDGLRNQIAGGMVQSASWTLYESVAFDHTHINSRDWSSYPILRFDNLFDSVEVEVINRPGQPFLGTGEAAQGPTAAAIANAIADATGQRIRELPFTRERVKAAIGV